MNPQDRLINSYYKSIGSINEAHNITLVQHTETGRIYVRKVLSLYSREVYEELRELAPTGIPRIQELLTEDDGSLILIEEQITGTTLTSILDESPMDGRKSCDVICALCDILSPLHSHEPPIVHRDLKPSNIMIDNHGNVILIDFNAAKYSNPDEKSDTLLIGTQGYAAPEQYGFRVSTPKTDIYSLGVILEQMLTQSDALTPALSAVVERCKKMEPTDRFDSVSELKEAIQQAMLFPESVPFPEKPKSHENRTAGTNENRHSPNPSDRNASSHPSPAIPTVNANFASVIHSFLPPGFRARNIAMWILAGLYYYLVFYVNLEMELREPTSARTLWIFRIGSLLIFLCTTFWLGNYRNIQRILKPCRSANRFIRYIGAILGAMLIIVFILFLIVVIAI